MLAMALATQTGCFSSSVQMHQTTASLPSIVLPQAYRAAQASSNDPTGGNPDNRPIAPGQTLELVDLTGPGMTTHCWFTIGSDDPACLSNLILQIRWDDAADASRRTSARNRPTET